jgi:deoxyadenosine/deoxycytidine kinase
MNTHNYIAIEGNIGAGKTTLARMLSADLNASLVLEQFEENSFLPKFYEDPPRYAFPLELSFLADRYQQLTEHFSKPDLFTTATIADFFIHKSLIFASSTLEPTEFSLFQRLFKITQQMIPLPDLVVFLYQRIPGLQMNILKRGRDYEQGISADYLGTIQRGYLDFFRQQPGINVQFLDMTDVDFVERPEDYKMILDMIVTGKKNPPDLSGGLFQYQ